MFLFYELSKNLCLYYNGYTLHPFREVHHPLVDQSLKPGEVDSLLAENEDWGTDDWMISEEDW